MTERRRARVEGVARDVVVEGGKLTWIDGRSFDAEEVEHLPRYARQFTPGLPRFEGSRGG
jgi:hypothetical protein